MDDIVPVSFVHPHMLEKGWVFENWKGETGDGLYGYQYLHQLYTHAIPDYTGRVTVPVLWDQVRETIVSNESSEIIRMFNSDFGDLFPFKTDHYTPELKD